MSNKQVQCPECKKKFPFRVGRRQIESDEKMEITQCLHCNRKILQRKSWDRTHCIECNEKLEAAKELTNVYMMFGIGFALLSIGTILVYSDKPQYSQIGLFIILSILCFLKSSDHWNFRSSLFEERT